MRLEGTMSAIVTPFTKDGALDQGALVRHIHGQIDAGMDAIVPCGTTGETPTLSLEEFQQVIRTTVAEVNGQIPVIAGTGSNNTKSTIEITRMARELGVDAALVVTPYYNKPGQNMLEAHYRMVAAEGGLPVVLYNVPGRTGTNMTAETTARLAQLDTVISVKEASGSLAQVQDILVRTQGLDFTVVSGDDALTLPMYSVGAHGVVSVAGNLVPGQVKAMRTAYLSGDITRAATIGRELFPLFEALFAETNPVPAKVGLQLLGLMASTVRMPLSGASDTTVARMRAVLTELGAL